MDSHTPKVCFGVGVLHRARYRLLLLAELHGNYGRLRAHWILEDSRLPGAALLHVLLGQARLAALD